MTDFRMTINGEPAAADASFDVVNPASTEVVAQAPDCGDDQLEAAMSGAAEAWCAWRLDEDARRQALRDAAEALESSAEELTPVLIAEQGKPVPEAMEEFTSGAAWLRYFADIELPGTPGAREPDDIYVEVVRRSLGVVAAITPWNFPVVLAMWKIAPALRAGNTVVLKPSPLTPLTTLAIGALLREVFPAGVLNVVTGQEPLGQRMTTHPIPQKISFTGSTPVGKHVASAAAAALKRVTLELGGNDPALVLEDADPAQVADELFTGAFYNNGQTCFAVKRVYAHTAIHDQLVEALTERARAARVGDGLLADTEFGPVTGAAQHKRVTGLVAEAVHAGATATAGGKPLDGLGYYYPPTILTNAAHGMRVVDEEQFGPVLPIISWTDLDEAVTLANDSEYGLTASVWSAEVERALAVADSLECGQVAVNSHGLGVRPDLPFGGWKASGIGVENGLLGVHEYTQPQVRVAP